MPGSNSGIVCASAHRRRCALNTDAEVARSTPSRPMSGWPYYGEWPPFAAMMTAGNGYRDAARYRQHHSRGEDGYRAQSPVTTIAVLQQCGRNEDAGRVAATATAQHSAEQRRTTHSTAQPSDIMPGTEPAQP